MKKVIAYMYENMVINYNIHSHDKIDIVNYSFGLIKNGKLLVEHLTKLEEVCLLRKKHPHLKIVLSV